MQGVDPARLHRQAGLREQRQESGESPISRTGDRRLYHLWALKCGSREHVERVNSATETNGDGDVREGATHAGVSAAIAGGCCTLTCFATRDPLFGRSFLSAVSGSPVEGEPAGPTPVPTSGTG